jgi:hypothetical protein
VLPTGADLHDLLVAQCFDLGRHWHAIAMTESKLTFFAATPKKSTSACTARRDPDE